MKLDQIKAAISTEAEILQDLQDLNNLNLTVNDLKSELTHYPEDYTISLKDLDAFILKYDIDPAITPIP